MAYKVSSDLYAAYVPLLKLDIYKEIIQIRKEFGIPTYGEVPPSIALAHVTILLNLLASSPYIQNRKEEFERTTRKFVKRNHLPSHYQKFAKLFIVYDVGATHIDLVSMPIKFAVTKTKDNKVTIKATLPQNFPAKEWSALYSNQIKPIMDGKIKPAPKLLRSTKSENLRIYYWLTLREITASQYLKKFRPNVKNNVFYQNKINSINYDVSKKINVL